MSSSDDPASLERFTRAQEGTFETALQELRKGRKRSHWMWFVFPQLRGLGRSQMAHHYGIADLDEAARYLVHPTLGPRLTACAEATLDHRDLAAAAILGDVDATKLRSCATLFDRLDGAPRVFDELLAAFYGGARCQRTLDRLR